MWGPSGLSRRGSIGPAVLVALVGVASPEAALTFTARVSVC